jgi:hypothetical protein
MNTDETCAAEKNFITAYPSTLRSPGGTYRAPTSLFPVEQGHATREERLDFLDTRRQKKRDTCAENRRSMRYARFGQTASVLFPRNIVDHEKQTE